MNGEFLFRKIESSRYGTIVLRGSSSHTLKTIVPYLAYLLENWKLEVVGPPGIEPGLNAPHALVLPVYYGPSSLKLRRASPPFRV